MLAIHKLIDDARDAEVLRSSANLHFPTDARPAENLRTFGMRDRFAGDPHRRGLSGILANAFEPGDPAPLIDASVDAVDSVAQLDSVGRRQRNRIRGREQGGERHRVLSAQIGRTGYSILTQTQEGVKAK